MQEKIILIINITANLIKLNGKESLYSLYISGKSLFNTFFLFLKNRKNQDQNLDLIFDKLLWVKQ